LHLCVNKSVTAFVCFLFFVIVNSMARAYEVLKKIKRFSMSESTIFIESGLIVIC
jgi:hypothetical protein